MRNSHLFDISRSMLKLCTFLSLQEKWFSCNKVHFLTIWTKMYNLNILKYAIMIIKINFTKLHYSFIKSGRQEVALDEFLWWWVEYLWLNREIWISVHITSWIQESEIALQGLMNKQLYRNHFEFSLFLINASMISSL